MCNEWPLSPRVERRKKKTANTFIFCDPVKRIGNEDHGHTYYLRHIDSTEVALLNSLLLDKQKTDSIPKKPILFLC